MLLTGQKIKKEYGIQTVLDIESLEIGENDRIGLIGRNGAGKSTLLKVLSGRESCDSGVIKRNCEIAEILQSGESDGIADGQQISRMHLQGSALMSGGEKTRISIAAAFSKHAPLLFADEPTTNLDMEGIEVLEKMLANYHGAVVLISHDRELLNHVCNQIWEINDGQLRIFPGNYDAWVSQSQREHDFAQFEYEQYRSEKRRLEKEVGQVKQKAKDMKKPPRRMSSSEWLLYKGIASQQQGHVSNRAAALNSRLSHLEKKEKPKDLPAVSMKLGNYQKIKAKTAAKVERISISYNEKEILEAADLLVASGKKTFLTGSNGSGKTSLVEKLINREPHTFITEDARVGYFSQKQYNLDQGQSVLEAVKSTAVLPEHICRAVLKNLYFDEHDLTKKIAVLSGGERVKTAIAKLLVSEVNFLIFDEPTNHMDIYTMEGFERLLKDYDGTVLIISHDRKLIQNLAEVVYEVRDKKVKLLD